MADLPRSPATVLAEDALLGLLLPFWQVVIGLFVLFALVASVRMLARRGPSRMTTALLVTAAAIAGLAVIGVLLQQP
ncbi:hypothetical protein O7606_26380 [Micromonospora sp. WMMD882]|uniref:hypothetical protein n=1 Tax=Micromonospora sp. WMMD882 TaxID=3015151 RepID=UPI00248AD6DA|nr:hypothetical protein [Micromonospora sp. WMMD882]WBB79628.1 hypothetical protein O7606_26380 [Micromonospora sp. WMMD882]